MAGLQAAEVSARAAVPICKARPGRWPEPRFRVPDRVPVPGPDAASFVDWVRVTLRAQLFLAHVVAVEGMWQRC